MFYGRKLGMSKQEILYTPIGEMLDMLACFSITEGGAKQKVPKRKLTMQEFMNLK